MGFYGRGAGVSYFSLANRVPEAAAVEPKSLAWLYWLITQIPFVRTAHRRFVAGALSQGVTQGVALDLGTGPGYVAQEVGRRQPALRIVGLDLAFHMVVRAQHEARGAGLNGKQLWPQADAHRLPFPRDSFDLVFSSYALHHWRDPLAILNEIARVLRPGGRYYIGDVCREVNTLQRFFAYGSVPVVSLAFGSYRGYGGYYESVRAGYTRDEAQAILKRSDLPPGKVGLDSTWLLSILTIASRGTA